MNAMRTPTVESYANFQNVDEIHEMCGNKRDYHLGDVTSLRPVPPVDDVSA